MLFFSFFKIHTHSVHYHVWIIYNSLVLKVPLYVLEAYIMFYEEEEEEEVQNTKQEEAAAYKTHKDTFS